MRNNDSDIKHKEPFENLCTFFKIKFQVKPHKNKHEKQGIDGGIHGEGGYKFSLQYQYD